MLSTIPPPRPISVNSLARSPLSPPLSFPKVSRCTSAEVQIQDGPEFAVPPASSPIGTHLGVDTEMEDSHASLPEDGSRPQSRPELRFENLPIEIHEAILDHIFGERASTVTANSPSKPSARSWSKALRHPRRKALSNLALISPIWRPLVQDRIYRHSESRDAKLAPPILVSSG